MALKSTRRNTANARYKNGLKALKKTKLVVGSQARILYADAGVV
jgi:hypothetical protein